MTTISGWAGRLLLRTPAPLRKLRTTPFIGAIVHGLSHRIISPDEKIWAQVEAGPGKGIWLRLNPRTGQHYLRGETELATQQILSECLRRGMVFYDLGANLGFFSLLAARLVGPEGKVFSFEPDATVARRLRENVERNGFSNVSIVESGVWCSSGIFDFVPAGSASPDLGTGKFAPGAAGRPTHCISIDDFVRNAPVPNAIKCDVEGAELQVVHGARAMLAAAGPWILLEVHSEEACSGCCLILDELGYAIRSVDSLHVFATPRNRENA